MEHVNHTVSKTVMEDDVEDDKVCIFGTSVTNLPPLTRSTERVERLRP